MGTGYDTLKLLEKVRCTADILGFKLTAPLYSHHEPTVGLQAKDTDLPLYSRDAELYCGSLEAIEIFFNGILWARNYDRMLKVSNEKIRVRKEKDVRNRNLIKTIKSTVEK